MMPPTEYNIFEELAHESCNSKSFGAELRSRRISKELTMSGTLEQIMYEGLKSQLSPALKKRKVEKGDDKAVAWLTTLEGHGQASGYTTPPFTNGGADDDDSPLAAASEAATSPRRGSSAASSAVSPRRGSGEAFVLPPS